MVVAHSREWIFHWNLYKNLKLIFIHSREWIKQHAGDTSSIKVGFSHSIDWMKRHIGNMPSTNPGFSLIPWTWICFGQDCLRGDQRFDHSVIWSFADLAIQKFQSLHFQSPYFPVGDRWRRLRRRRFHLQHPFRRKHSQKQRVCRRARECRVQPEQ